MQSRILFLKSFARLILLKRFSSRRYSRTISQFKIYGTSGTSALKLSVTCAVGLEELAKLDMEAHVRLVDQTGAFGYQCSTASIQPSVKN